MKGKHIKCGLVLYSFLPIAYLTGAYRLFNFKSFRRLIRVGLIFDLVLSGMAFLII